MDEPEALALGPDHSGLHRLGYADSGPRPKHGGDQGDRRLCQRCDDLHRLAGITSERGETGADQCPQVLRDWQRLAGDEVRVAAVKGAGQLECEERVAPRCAMHPHKRAVGETPRGLSVDHLVEGDHAQRSNLDAPKPPARESVGHVERIDQTGFDPQRDSDADRSKAEAPQHEVQHPGGGTVEPLHVVNSDHHWGDGAEQSQHAEHGNRHGALVRRVPAVGRSEERDVKGAALRFGQGREHVSADCVEQVAQAAVRQPGLGLTRAGHQHSEAVAPSALYRRLPQRRLTYARLAGHQQPCRAGGNGLEELLDAGLIRLPPDHRRTGHASSQGQPRPRPANRSWTVISCATRRDSSCMCVLAYGHESDCPLGGVGTSTLRLSFVAWLDERALDPA